MALQLSPMEVIFDLVVPSKALALGPSTPTATFSFVFPFGPQLHRGDDPFATSFAPGLDGGLTTHESGIIQRPFALAGSFGVAEKPRRFAHGTFVVGAFTQTNLPELEQIRRATNENPFEPMGGLEQLQFLQDNFFRAYGELKRTPEYAPDTKLIYHNLRTDEHFLVVPLNFSVTSAAPRYQTFSYAIQLVAVAPAGKRSIFEVNADSGFIGSIRNAVRKLNDAVDSVRAKIAAVSKIVNDTIRAVGSAISAVRNVFAVVTQVVQMVTSAVSAVEGVITSFESLVTAPAAILTGLKSAIDSVDSLVGTAVSMPANIADTYSASIRSLGRSLDVLVTRVKSTATVANGTFRSGLTNPARTSQNSLVEPSAKGIAIDPRSALPKTDADRLLRRVRRGHDYKSVVQLRVDADTDLRVIARSIIGVESAWQDIATLNGLHPPFISNEGLPGTLIPGSPLLVPIRSRVQSLSGPDAGLVGAEAATDPNARVYGRDFALSITGTPLSGAQFDFMLSANSGDFATAVGPALVKQAVTVRAASLLGDDPIAPGMGLGIEPGSAATATELALAKVRARDFCLQDPRVQSIRSLEVAANLDRLDIVADLQLVSGGQIIFTG